MANLRDLITPKEYKILDFLRSDKMYVDEDVVQENFISSRDWVAPWEEAKNQSIAIGEVFKDTLIYKKKINVCSSENDEDALNEIDDLVYKYIKQDEIHRKLAAVIVKVQREKQNKSFVHYLSEATSISVFTNWLSGYLFNDIALWRNIYDGERKDLITPDDKVLSIMPGCKVIRMIGKLFNTFMKDQESVWKEAYERLRLEHSRILNTKFNRLINLCISIHPIDYLTASMNANKWRSCMNWKNGEYRMGVLEMMTSNSVVVAYIESASRRLEFPKADAEWNSKQWREFFIINDVGVFGIKGYPYWDHDLEDEAMTFIKELFAPVFAKYNITFSKKSYRVPADNDEELTLDDPEQGINNLSIQLSCGPAMYNDFYNEIGHMYLYNLLSSIQQYQNQHEIFFNYSGEGICAICGGSFYDCGWCTDDITEQAHRIICKDCERKYVYCNICCEKIYLDEHPNGIHYIEQMPVCDSCYESAPNCAYCNSKVSGLVSWGLIYDTDKDPVLSGNLAEIMEHDARRLLYLREDKEQPKVFLHECHIADGSIFNYNPVAEYHRYNSLSIYHANSAKTDGDPLWIRLMPTRYLTKSGIEALSAKEIFGDKLKAFLAPNSTLSDPYTANNM